LSDLKKQLDSRDEEWKVIAPNLQKVIAARQVLQPGFSGGTLTATGAGSGRPPTGEARPEPPGGPGGRGPGPGGFGGAPASANPLSQAQADLKTVLDDPKHSPEERQAKIDAVRAARQKAHDDLTAAQKDLLQLLTAKQTAVLLSLGIIE
jgi:hypothetical protein